MSILIILGILILIGFAFVVYRKKQQEEKEDESEKVVKCKYSDWSDCDCNTRRTRRTLLEGDSKTCRDTLRACVPKSNLCCKYSGWGDCDCKTKTKERLLLSGDPEVCFETQQSCEIDPELCCEYTNFGICDCNTNLKTKDLKSSEAELGFCDQTITEQCTDAEYKKYCCEYSPWNQNCDCNNNTVSRTLVRGNSEKCRESLLKSCTNQVHKEQCCTYSSQLTPTDWCPCNGKKKRSLVNGFRTICDQFKEESCTQTEKERWACQRNTQANIEAMNQYDRRQYIDNQTAP